jgi:CBS domain-containing protein
MYDSGALTLEAQDVMTPGVVTVTEDATLGDAVDAMSDHRIHAVLVIARKGGAPLGWITARGLLAKVGCDPGMGAADAIDEEARSIEPDATLRAAIYALALPGVTRLLVRTRGDAIPTGVITDYDLTVRATQLSRRPA